MPLGLYFIWSCTIPGHAPSLNPTSIAGDDLFQLGPELAAAVLDEVLIQVGSGIHHSSLELVLWLVLDTTELALQTPKDGVVQRGCIRAVRGPEVLGKETGGLGLQEFLSHIGCMTSRTVLLKPPRVSISAPGPRNDVLLQVLDVGLCSEPLAGLQEDKVALLSIWANHSDDLQVGKGRSQCPTSPSRPGRTPSRPSAQWRTLMASSSTCWGTS